MRRNTKKIIIIHLSSKTLPTLQELTLDVQHVNSPTSFWCHYTDQKTCDAYDKLHASLEQAIGDMNKRQMRDRAKNMVVAPKRQLRIGCVYIAPHTTELGDFGYYRARLDG